MSGINQNVAGNLDIKFNEIKEHHAVQPVQRKKDCTSRVEAPWRRIFRQPLWKAWICSKNMAQLAQAKKRESESLKGKPYDPLLHTLRKPDHRRTSHTPRIALLLTRMQDGGQQRTAPPPSRSEVSAVWKGHAAINDTK
jgi:hypothetical protein